MTPAELARAVVGAVRRAVEAGELDVPVPDVAAVKVTRARGAGRGEYATGIALRLAGPAGLPARTVAERVARHLTATPEGTPTPATSTPEDPPAPENLPHPAIERIDIAGPGFLNITLAATAHADLVRVVRAAGARYGHGDVLAAAPLVPPAPSGDDPRSAAVVRVLRACGAPVGPCAVAVRHPAYATLGADAANWALVRPPAGDPPDLAPATHLPQRTANPLFRIRYAHARTRALTRNAADLGFAAGEFTPAAADEPAQAALLGAIGDYPRVVESAARHRAPDRVARALEGVADAFLDYHDSVALLPSGDGKPSAAHRSRLALADAAGTVLAGGLSLLGISAPAHL